MKECSGTQLTRTYSLNKALEKGFLFLFSDVHLIGFFWLFKEKSKRSIDLTVDRDLNDCSMVSYDWRTYPPVTWWGQPEDRWIPLAFGLAKDFVPAILIMGHFSDFWTKFPGRGTKYFSPPHLFPSYSLCLALPFKVYLDSVPSWKHPTTPPCPVDLVFPLFHLS